VQALRFAIVGLFVAALTIGPAFAQQAEKKPTDKPSKAAADLPKCPVSDMPVSFYQSVKTDDGPVYLCCPKCVSAFEAKKAELKDKVAAQRAALAKLPKVQVTCPVGGEPVSAEFTSSKGGQDVQFCCDKCKAKYEADPAAYKAKLAESYTYQTQCPLMGEPIDPAMFVDVGGQRVYVCCEKCQGRVQSNPQKAAGGLAKQGYKLETAAAPKKP
jgi:YHS domain-containing protein